MLQHRRSEVTVSKVQSRGQLRTSEEEKKKEKLAGDRLLGMMYI